MRKANIEINGLNDEIWHYEGGFIGFKLNIVNHLKKNENNLIIHLPNIDSFQKLKKHLLIEIEDLEEEYFINFENNFMQIFRRIEF